MALIPPFFLDTVVALGAYGDGGQLHWMASGFLYGYYSHTSEDGKKHYWVYLVTNRHVLENKDRVCVRFNTLAHEAARTYNMKLTDQEERRIWFAAPTQDADVAVVKINTNLLTEEGIRFRFFRSDENTATLNTMRESGVSEGDGVFILGFPMGIVGEERNYVIVRSGSIARIRHALGESSCDFLLDAFIFPGNSGGPVVLKPEVAAIEGTNAIAEAYLLGVVAGYAPYIDVAVSKQTGQTRVVFEENSGLATVQPIDFVHEAIDEHRKTVDRQRDVSDLRAPEATTGG